MKMEDVILVATVREEIRGGALRVKVADIPRHVVKAVAEAQKDKLGAEMTAKADAEANAKEFKDPKLGAVERKTLAKVEAGPQDKVEAVARENREAEAKAKVADEVKVNAGEEEKAAAAKAELGAKKKVEEESPVLFCKTASVAALSVPTEPALPPELFNPWSRYLDAWFKRHVRDDSPRTQLSPLAGAPMTYLSTASSTPRESASTHPATSITEAPPSARVVSFSALGRQERKLANDKQDGKRFWLTLS
jgi:hypothetical protein